MLSPGRPERKTDATKVRRVAVGILTKTNKPGNMILLTIAAAALLVASLAHQIQDAKEAPSRFNDWGDRHL